MDNTYSKALAYLSAPTGSFWHWDDNGAVVVWYKGSTIAFREELAAVLQRLAPQGLPALDPVLLLIAAVRAYWAEDSLELQHDLRAGGEFQKVNKTGQLCSELFARLNIVHDLPDEFIGTPAAKAELAAIVFEAAPRIVPPDVATVVCDVLYQRLNSAIPALAKLNSARAQTTKALLDDLWQLNCGLDGITEESLRLRRETGLESEPEPAPEIDFADPSTTWSLLQSLSDDEELSGLSRLARNLAAVVQLPRSVSDSDDLPIGGISDLSNRGSLDRLLLSELAHDDLMLATRIALNEALYLRREVPPTFPPERRHVLIDSGLRMWGIPRVFATAVALSLAATGQRDATLRAYRATSKGAVPVRLSTREGLLEHMGDLETDAHPGKSLQDFFDRTEQSDSPGDRVLITTEAVLQDPDFARDFAEAEVPPIYIATVNREGNFQLWFYGPRGRKSQTSLKLDLDELLKAPARKPRPLIDSSIDPNRPAITRVTPFPFRMAYSFSQNSTRDTLWCFPLRWGTTSPPPLQLRVSGGLSESIESRFRYGLVVLTRDRRLLLFDDPTRGGFLLGEELPYGKCVGSWSNDDASQTFAVIHRPSEAALYLFRVDLDRRTVAIDRLPSVYLSYGGSGSQILGATHHGGVLFVIFRTMIEAFDVHTTALLNSTHTELPSSWTRSRYFFNHAAGHRDAWYAMSFDGRSIIFQHVPIKKYAHRTLTTLFDRRGHDGAFGFDTAGNLVNITTQTDSKVAGIRAQTISCLDVTDDGRQALLHSPLTDCKSLLPDWADMEFVAELVDLETEAISTVTHPMCPISRVYASRHASRQGDGWLPMKRFARIAVIRDRLVLISKRGRRWIIGDRSTLFTADGSPADMVRLARMFQATRRTRSPYSLAVAEWIDGSRAWLDSRGMLHLRSSDPSIPEATIVLAANASAAWTSHGRTVGLHYYFSNTESMMPVDQFITTVLVPFVERLR